jgi:hypothetical protein
MVRWYILDQADPDTACYSVLKAGFQNIRILDAAFLVQASTGAGQQVIMVINTTLAGMRNRARPADVFS